MQIPDTLFYYYDTKRPPFESMSELADAEFVTLMDQLAKSEVSANRFDESWKRDFYAFFRPYTESHLRRRFLEAGGEPVLRSPRYMTLGPTDWFFDWYPETSVIEMPLSAIPDEHISFTYPDSMTSLLIAEDRYEPFAKYKKPYHGQVYRRSHLQQLIDQYGMPDETDAENLEYGNRIIEAQIWDMTPLTRYVEAAKVT